MEATAKHGGAEERRRAEAHGFDERREATRTAGSDRKHETPATSQAFVFSIRFGSVSRPATQAGPSNRVFGPPFLRFSVFGR